MMLVHAGTEAVDSIFRNMLFLTKTAFQFYNRFHQLPSEEILEWGYSYILVFVRHRLTKYLIKLIIKINN